jgi:acetyltransferase-like isoleucine patch superfamily enzyme
MGERPEHAVASDAVEKRDIPVKHWYTVRNPVRIVANTWLGMACKPLPFSVKNVVYRALGVDIGEGSVLAPNVEIDPIYPDKITIGEDTVIGMGTKLLTHEWYAHELHVGPIEIGDEVTFGHDSSTRPGVTIGDGATVAAHSFVNRDVEPGEKVGGVPIETL